METITEDYVSFETAKLLKEKGFPQDPNICSTVYKYNGIFCTNAKSFWNPFVSEILNRQYYMAPTIQMAMKWLRNTFHLEIYPFHDAIQENNDWWYSIELYSKGCSLTEHESDVIYKTCEQACESAIKYCLENLI